MRRASSSAAWSACVAQNSPPSPKRISPRKRNAQQLLLALLGRSEPGHGGSKEDFGIIGHGSPPVGAPAPHGERQRFDDIAPAQPVPMRQADPQGDTQGEQEQGDEG